MACGPRDRSGFRGWFVMSTSGNSASSRRQFLGATSLVGASLAAVDLLSTGRTGREQPPASKLEHGYKYRIAFGCWVNDMRSQALPLQQWPAPHPDEITVLSIIAAMDVQSRAGFNYLDAWGLFATYGLLVSVLFSAKKGLKPIISLPILLRTSNPAADRCKSRRSLE